MSSSTRKRPRISESENAKQIAQTLTQLEQDTGLAGVIANQSSNLQRESVALSKNLIGLLQNESYNRLNERRTQTTSQTQSAQRIQELSDQLAEVNAELENVHSDFELISSEIITRMNTILSNITQLQQATLANIGTEFGSTGQYENSLINHFIDRFGSLRGQELFDAMNDEIQAQAESINETAQSITRIYQNDPLQQENVYLQGARQYLTKQLGVLQSVSTYVQENYNVQGQNFTVRSIRSPPAQQIFP